jgi:phage gp36-like protein
MYANRLDLEKWLGVAEVQMLSCINADGTPDPSVILERLESASNEIDSFVSQRYTLPLASVPSDFKQHCCTIGRYWLMNRISEKDTRHNTDYERVLQRLALIANGKIQLAGNELRPTASESNGLLLGADLPIVRSGRADWSGF